MADDRKDFSEFMSDGWDIRVNEPPKERDTKPKSGEDKSSSKPTTPAGDR